MTITELLDAYLEALVDAGYTDRFVRPGSSEQNIATALETAGYAVRDDLVEYFQWAQYPGGQLFQYHATPYSVDIAVRQGLWLRDFWTSEDPNFLSYMVSHPKGAEDSKPIDPDWKSWLPIAMGVDSLDEIMIEASSDSAGVGSVWCKSKEDYFRAFDSLADAILAATYCVEANIWSISDDGVIQCPTRKSAPSIYDLATPPHYRYNPGGSE